MRAVERYPQSDGQAISTSRFVPQHTAQICFPSAGHERLALRWWQTGHSIKRGKGRGVRGEETLRIALAPHPLPLIRFGRNCPLFRPCHPVSSKRTVVPGAASNCLRVAKSPGNRRLQLDKWRPVSEIHAGKRGGWSPLAGHGTYDLFPALTIFSYQTPVNRLNGSTGE